MGKPRCLLLDEPSLGLAPKMVAELFRILRQICDQGTGVLLVEQNVRQALSVCNHAYILEHGQIVSEGAGQDLLRGERIRKSYLGLWKTHPGRLRGIITRRAGPYASLNRIRKSNMSTISMLINGNRVQARNGAQFERRNPLDGSVATTAPAASVEDATAAVDAAARAFPAWAAIGPG